MKNMKIIKSRKITNKLKAIVDYLCIQFLYFHRLPFFPPFLPCRIKDDKGDQ